MVVGSFRHSLPRFFPQLDRPRSRLTQHHIRMGRRGHAQFLCEREPVERFVVQ